MGARAVAFAAAAAVATGIGFGATTVARGPAKSVAVSAAIPSPLRGSGAFFEDDNLTGQDNQSNILSATASGLVHLMSGGTSVAVGLVLTPSGKVLTSDQAIQGTGKLTAKFITAGGTFGVKVIGADPAADLALLQLEGSGEAFHTVSIGNSATLLDSTYASQEVSWHEPGEVYDTAIGSSGTSRGLIIDLGNLIALNASTNAGGATLTGLMESRLQSGLDQGTGGPLVDLNGRVIGITVAGAGAGFSVNSFAVPINQALAVAKQIDARHNS
jgi:S1-C subfamily serine protease